MGAGQTVGSFGPNRPFAATLAEKAAFAGRQRHRAQGGIGRLWFFNDLQRRIPALRDGDVTLADSSVICHYLDDRDPQATPLCGGNALARARIIWLEKYADYEVAPLATFTVFRNRLLKPLLGKPCDEAAVEAALQEKLPPHFDYLEGCLGEAEYFVDDRFSLADIAVASQLVNMRHGGEVLDAGRWPRLAAHLQRMLQRPALQALLEGEQRVVDKIRARIAQAPA